MRKLTQTTNIVFGTIVNFIIRHSSTTVILRLDYYKVT